MEWRIWITWWIRYSRLFWIYIKKTWGKTINTSVSIYTNKIENRIASKFKAGYYPKVLTPEAMKVPWSTKSKLTKDKNGENVPYL